MTAIFNIITTIVNAVITIYKVITMPFTMMIELGRVVGSTVITWSNTVLGLPTWLVGFATACIAINVLFLLFGREAGK